MKSLAVLPVSAVFGGIRAGLSIFVILAGLHRGVVLSEARWGDRLSSSLSGSCWLWLGVAESVASKARIENSVCALEPGEVDDVVNVDRVLEEVVVIVVLGSLDGVVKDIGEPGGVGCIKNVECLGGEFSGIGHRVVDCLRDMSHGVLDATIFDSALVGGVDPLSNSSDPDWLGHTVEVRVVLLVRGKDPAKHSGVGGGCSGGGINSSSWDFALRGVCWINIGGKIWSAGVSGGGSGRCRTGGLLGEVEIGLEGT